MRCPETNEIAAYLDGAVTHAERIRWDDHFQQCGKCRKDLEELRLLLALEPVDPGEECVARGMSLVDGARCMRGETGAMRSFEPGLRN